MTRESNITDGVYRFDLINEFDLNAFVRHEWGLKKCFPTVNIPNWFKQINSVDHIVMYDWFECVFIDGEEKHADIFQLEYFRNITPLSIYFNSCSNIIRNK